MRVGVAEKNEFRDRVWRGRNWDWNMLPDPCCCLSLLVRVFLDTNGLKVKYCQVLEEFLLIVFWDVESIQLLKKRSSQFVNILWVKMFNTITTSNQMSFQIPRLWEKCVTRSTPEGFEQCIDVVNVANVIVAAWKLDSFFILLNTSSTELSNQFCVYKIKVIKEDIKLQPVFNFRNVIQMNTLEFWNVSILTVIEEKFENLRSLLLQFFVTLQM